MPSASRFPNRPHSGPPCPSGRGAPGRRRYPRSEAQAPPGPAAAMPPPQRGAESSWLAAPHRSLPLRRAERQLPRPMALRARAPATNGRRRDSGQTPARSGGGGSASRRAAAAAGTRRGLPPPAPAPRRPAHREAWLRLLLARGPGTSLLSSPASQARGRAGASRGRLAGLLAGGSGTRNGPYLLSAPCCSCRARKHPGIPEEGGGAAAGPRLAPPPRSRPEARGSAGSGGGGGSGCSPPGLRPAACRAVAEVSLRRWAAGAPPRSAPLRPAPRCRAASSRGVAGAAGHGCGPERRRSGRGAWLATGCSSQRASSGPERRPAPSASVCAGERQLV